MNEPNLQQQLEKLRAEVNRLEGDRPEVRDQLTRLISDLESHGQTPDTGTHQGLIERVRGYIDRFETEHPRATAILNDIMVTLGNMGI